MQAHNEFVDKITQLIVEKFPRPIFVVIDGPAGAGKTTLANSIISEIGYGEIIHCDDLYNGWDDALTPTLGENIKQWILNPLTRGELPSYQKYDWALKEFSGAITLTEGRLIILEGVGSAMKNVTDCADLSIWIDIPYQEGFDRVLRRDGQAIHREMLSWLDKQRDFFAIHKNQENCDVHLSGRSQ